MRVMPWIVAIADAAGIVVGVALNAVHRTGDDPLTAESAREIEDAARDGREWRPDEGQSWFVRNPVPSGAGVAVVVLVVGSLVVIAVNSERGRR